MNPVIAICIGACAGALARWQLALGFNSGWLPWGTLAANWIGAYAVGLAVVFFQSHAGLDPAWRLFVITGVLGALTTFSTFSAEAITLLQQGRLLSALAHTGLHLLGSLLLAWLGMLSAQRVWGPAA